MRSGVVVTEREEEVYVSAVKRMKTRTDFFVRRKLIRVEYEGSELFFI